MEDIPQPAESPYDKGDRVRVYIDPGDVDADEYHGAEAVVIDRFEDNLSEETGRELDRYTYRVRQVDNNDVLDVEFRHRDLVPTE